MDKNFVHGRSSRNLSQVNRSSKCICVFVCALIFFHLQSFCETIRFNQRQFGIKINFIHIDVKNQFKAILTCFYFAKMQNYMQNYFILIDIRYIGLLLSRMFFFLQYSNSRFIARLQN